MPPKVRFARISSLCADSLCRESKPMMPLSLPRLEAVEPLLPGPPANRPTLPRQQQPNAGRKRRQAGARYSVALRLLAKSSFHSIQAEHAEVGIPDPLTLSFSSPSPRTLRLRRKLERLAERRQPRPKQSELPGLYCIWETTSFFAWLTSATFGPSFAAFHLCCCLCGVLSARGCSPFNVILDTSNFSVIPIPPSIPTTTTSSHKDSCVRPIHAVFLVFVLLV